MKQSDEQRLHRKKLNIDQRRSLRSEEIRLFEKQIGRKAQKGVEPNDRKHSRKTERAIKQMRPEELDSLLRDGDED